MNHAEAVALRARQLQGEQVDPAEVAQAIAVIQATRTPTAHRPKGRKKPPKPAAVPATVPAPMPSPMPADPWPLITPETEAQVLAAAHNAWAYVGREQ